MAIKLQKAKREDLELIHSLQIQALGQEAVYELERLYPYTQTLTLDTIFQEKKLCHFYEKLGYKDTGKRQSLKAGMDIIYYMKRRG